MTRTISCRLSDELFRAVEDVCKEKGLNITEAVTIGLKKVCEGKIPVTPLRGKAVYCPVCGFALYPVFEKNYILWACARCGFRGQSEEPEWRSAQKFTIEREKK